jgi:hypothetical protein
MVLWHCSAFETPAWLLDCCVHLSDSALTRTVLTRCCSKATVTEKCVYCCNGHSQQASDSLSSAAVAALTTATAAALVSEQQRLSAMTTELEAARQKTQRYQAALAAAVNRCVTGSYYTAY